MSQTIDHRVVEMRFDNKQFEAGAKQTMGTLGKLKEALKLPDTKKSLEGIDKATKNIKLDGIASGVAALERRFSALGIVGMRVIENITDGLMGKLHSAVSFVTDSIVSGGIKRAMNIENAHFQLQALLKDETKVQAVMANAMEAVDGTAYAYDEAAKAASQFAASGIQAGEEMMGALKGITGVAAMTNSDFESISRIFTTVAGNGRLMGDQLLQLSSRGLNAASTLADYFREVRGQSEMTESTIREMVSDGEISFKDFSEAMTWAFGDSAKRANETFTGAMSNMKSALARIGAGFISPLVEQNGELVQLFNALRIKINDVKSELVFDEQRSAISGLADATKMSKDELSEMFNTIKTNGTVSIGELDALSKKGADSYGALTKYVNGVTNGSIRASYAISSALSELTNGTKVSTEDIKRFVEEGKIDLATFTSAMETEFGTEKKLSNQFTDWFLDHIHGIVEAINAADMSKPMEIFYHGVESIKNIVKGLLSVLRPVAKAFSDVFFNFNVDDVNKFSASIEKLTAKLKLSKEGSKDLHDAFQGLFSVVKLVVDIFFDLLGAIVPINKPMLEMGDGFLGLIGSIGRGLTSFTKMIRSCKLLKNAFGALQTGFSMGTESLTKLIKIGKNFISTLSKMEGTAKLIDAVNNAFKKLTTKATPYIENFIKEAEDMFKSLFNIGNIDLDDILESISQAFADLAYEIEHFSFKSVENAFDTLRKKVKAFGDLIMSNDGIATFVTNAKKFGEDLRDAFSWDAVMSRIEKIMDVFGKFFRWFKEIAAPAFEDFNLGSVAATGGGIGIIYAMIKAAKAFEKLSNSVTAIPDLLGGIKGTLVAYQKELKAEALLKTAAAIAVLAGALVLLSFADTDRLLGASLALSMIAGTLMLGVSKMLDAVNKGRALNDSLRIFSKGLSSTMKKFGRAMEIRAVGAAVKNFAISIAVIAASIIALGAMWRKDSEAFNNAIVLIGGIAGVLVAIIAIMTIASKIGDPKGMAAIGTSVLMITASLMIIVMSISKLMKMKLPEDYGVKLAILGGIIGGLAGLAVALGLAARISGNNQLPKMASTIRSLAILLLATVISLNMLFKMDLPSDYDTKLKILAGIFVGFAAMLVAMGVAARISGGNGFKAAGTILAMAAFLVVVVGSLFVLTLIPADKMLKGALALGGILIALGVALAGAGKISEKDTYKSVLAMALTVGVITGALAVLSMIPWKKLLVSATSLGAVLLILAGDFLAVSKVKAKNAIPVILAMIVATMSIAYSLYILSKQPWEGMLAAGAAMSAVLMSFAKSFKTIGSQNWSIDNLKNVGTFLLMTLAVVSIGAALYILASQPWEGMLAAGAALSVTILAFSKAFQIITNQNWSIDNLKNVGTFLLMTLAVVSIGPAIALLALQDWKSLLAAAGSLSLTLVALTLCFAILSKVKVNLTTIAAVVAGSASLLLVSEGISKLAKYDGDSLLNACLALSAMLLVMVGVMAACGALSSVVGPAMAGVLGLGVVIAEIALVLAAIGKLSEIEGLRWLIDEGGELLEGIGTAIGKFIGGIVGGILSGITSQLPQIASDLSKFMINLQPFIIGSKMLDSESVTNVGFLAAIIAALTASEIINGIANLFGLSLVDIAVELSNFMVALTPFIIGSKMLDESSAKACGYIADMILKLTSAQLLQGITQFFGLSGKLSDFAEELKDFGPAITEFADTVKDVNPEAVQGAASAASIMAEVAEKLQGHGGLWQDIVGDKSLKTFAEELKDFGPAITEFADTVKDVNPEAVQGAASAASIMAEVANKLPEGESLKSKIFGGSVSLATFGEELTSFGKAIVPFCEAVRDVNPASIVGVTAVTTVMSTLADNLPETNSLWDKIFGGGKVSLSEFGEEFIKFGTTMSEFSSTVTGINLDQVQGAIESFHLLVELAEYVQGKSANEFVNFSKQLSQLGTDSIEKFVQAFSGAEKKVKSAMESLLKTITSTTTNTLKTDLSSSKFDPIGSNIVDGLIKGIKSKRPSLDSIIDDICKSIIEKIKKDLKKEDFEKYGENLIIWLNGGIERKKNIPKNNIVRICDMITETFKINLKESVFKEIGENMILGLKNGIESKSGEVAQAAAKAAQTAVDSTKKALDEHSPSKIMHKVGEFFDKGLEGGILDHLKGIAIAAEKAGSEAVKPVKTAVDAIKNIIDSDDFDVDPVVRPIVDLSNVQKGVREIGSLMNQTYDLSAMQNSVISASSSFSQNGKSNVSENPTKKSENSGDTYEFNQYNYSPKALTRSEIYRQTNNQFSAFKRVVNPT